MSSKISQKNAERSDYWAMQGFSGVTWRGQDLQAVLPAMAVVFGFAIFFAALAQWRFRWEE